MCGIIGYIGKGDATAAVINALKRMEYRGYDSSGYAIIDGGGGLIIEKDSVRAGMLNAVSCGAHIGIGHTRWATHGKPSKENAHPHVSYDGMFAVVHNGIVENAAELKAEALSRITFVSETDSEVIAHLMSLEYTRLTDSDMIKLDEGGNTALEYICPNDDDGSRRDGEIRTAAVYSRSDNDGMPPRYRKNRQGCVKTLNSTEGNEHRAADADIISDRILKALENCVKQLRGAYSFAV
ncbi:MAG: class II glutamine amidotransferase, partial [Clostridiales bacterium]|nr:class II glutamine amidotransferase [Clostridiales bacterium]